MFFGYITALLLTSSDIDAKPFPQDSSVSVTLNQNLIERRFLDEKESDVYIDESSLAQDFGEDLSPVVHSDINFPTGPDIDDISSDSQDSPIIASLEGTTKDFPTFDNSEPSPAEYHNPLFAFDLSSSADCISQDGHRKRDMYSLRKHQACPANRLPGPKPGQLPWNMPELGQKKPQNNPSIKTKTKSDPCPARKSRGAIGSQIQVPEKSKHVSCGGPAVGKTTLYPIHVLNCVAGNYPHQTI